MADELKFPGSDARADRDSLGEPLVSLIRDAYAAPEGDAYWTGLEQRIMARVAAEAAGDTPWWNVLAPWARPALIAAVAIFALAGIIDQRLGESDSQITYDSVIQATTPDVVATSEELISVERGVDGATLSYFLSH
jgi:hypothetical protein